MWHAWARRGMCTRFLWNSQKERDLLGDQGVDRRMGSGWILGKIGLGGVDWIRLAQDGDRWRAFVNTVMNFWVLAQRN
jgi:hypothetical protein